MAWDTEYVASTEQTLIQEAQRAFMGKVYRWMFLGLAITGFTAFAIASNVPLAITVARHYWLTIIAEIAVVIPLLMILPRGGGRGRQMTAGSFQKAFRTPLALSGGLYILFCAITGVSLSAIFLVYGLGTVFQAFFVTAGLFGAMSIYGAVTKKDLSSWGSFLYIGLIGVVLASVAQIFVHSGMLGFVVDCAAVVVFTGLTAYDQQKIRQMHLAAGGGEVAARLSILGALMLYLDFINLFIALVELLGGGRRR